MAKAVLLVLIGFSLTSWGIMLWKLVQLRRADRHSVLFLDAFRRSKRFSEVTAMAAKVHASPLLGLFQAGYAEIDSQIKSADSAAGAEARRYRVRSMTSVERSLRRALSAELAELSRASQFLATTAAATPFIGLFGTVWGIMVSFEEIGLTGSTSLDTIAPGIAESLINTAAGLAAAIPALIGYNYFAGRLRHLRARMEDFAQEFLNLTERNFT
jgi:biopolymer transport protein TolQ